MELLALLEVGGVVVLEPLHYILSQEAGRDKLGVGQRIKNGIRDGSEQHLQLQLRALLVLRSCLS